ncbi:hypothetical protein GCM10010336_51800 [Streptomyces goshikiensis]|nr:hypothetical protein GCM10010336_51800 [Streptomyces goshikiensis]
MNDRARCVPEPTPVVSRSARTRRIGKDRTTKTTPPPTGGSAGSRVVPTGTGWGHTSRDCQ